MAAVLLGFAAPSVSAAEATAKPDAESVQLEDLVNEDPQFARYLEWDQRDNDAANGEGDLSSLYGSDRTLNPNPTDDQRIAALWWRNKKGFPGNASTRFCTAEHVGGRWWITARHCIPGSSVTTIGFLESTDGSFAGIERWWFPEDENYDVALIRVGSGLTSKPSFDLPSRSLAKNETFSVLGFAQSHGFASSSRFKKLYDDTTVSYDNEEGRSYSHLTTAVYADGEVYPIEGGDSGGAVYQGTELFGVISGHADDDSKFFLAEISPLVDWIRDLQKTVTSVSWGDVWDSYHGGRAAIDDERIGPRITLPRGKESHKHLSS